jgi:hypothetical protein
VDASPAKRPRRMAITGQHVTIAPLDPAMHGQALWEGTQGAENDVLWAYLFAGPFTDRAEFDAYLIARAYLMARHVFEELGYRRYEWKCDALNEASRRAALRLGFTFEGVFRQHMIVKGRNRDTAWFSMLDGEWPVRKARFERWLDPSNFDASGRQRSSLVAV